jgi:hypothetical protein
MSDDAYPVFWTTSGGGVELVPGIGCALSIQISRGLFALRKVDLMLLVDDIAGHLPMWKANLMNKSGCTTLTKVTLSAIPIHISLAVTVSLWINNAIDRVRRSFVSAGTSSVSGGKCMVAWARVTRRVYAFFT